MAIAQLKSIAIPLDAQNIPDSGTADADVIELATVRSAKWLITVSDTANTLYSTVEVLAIHNNTLVNYTVSNKVGDFLAYVVSVIIDGTNLKLQIANNHTSQIDTNIVRIALS